MMATAQTLISGIDLHWPLCAPRGPSTTALGWERLTLWNVTPGATEAEGARPRHLLPPMPATGLPAAIAFGVNRAAVRTPAGAPTTLIYGDYLVRVINQSRRMLATRSPKVTKTVEAVRESKTPGVMEIIPEAIARFTMAVGEGEFYAVRSDGSISYTNNSVSLIVDTGTAKPDMAPGAYELQLNATPEKGGLNDMYMLLREKDAVTTSLYLFRKGVATKVVFIDPVFGDADAQVRRMFDDGRYMHARMEIVPMGMYAAMWVWHGDATKSLCILDGAVGKVADFTADNTWNIYAFGRVVQLTPTLAMYSRNGIDRTDSHNGVSSMVFVVALNDASAPVMVNRETFFSSALGTSTFDLTYSTVYVGLTISLPVVVANWTAPQGTDRMPATPQIVALGNGHAMFTASTLRVPAGVWGTYDDYKPRSWFAVYHYANGVTTEIIPPKETPGYMAAAEVLYYPCGSGACLIATPRGVGWILDEAGKQLGYELSYFRPGQPLLALPGLTGDVPLAFVLKGNRSAEFITQEGPHAPSSVFVPARRVWEIKEAPGVPPVLLTNTFNELDLGYPHADLLSTNTGFYLAPGQCAFLSVVHQSAPDEHIGARAAGVTLRARVYSDETKRAELRTLIVSAGNASTLYKDAPKYAVINTTRNGVKRAVFVTTISATGGLHIADVPAPSSAVVYLHEKTLCDAGSELRVLNQGGTPTGTYPGYSLSPLPSKPPVPSTSSARALTPVGQNICTYWPELFIDLTTEVFARN